MHDWAGPVFWAAATLGVYGFARWLDRRRRRWWTSPLLVTWVTCGALIILFHTTWREYLRGTHWLVTLLGPATVAFALPIYEQRALIRRHAGTLALGVLTGSVIAAGSGWVLANLLHLSPALRMSLLPRSVTTPLAMATSESIGGIPGLTASFTAITGLFGAAVGETVIACLPLRTAFARGALFGMGAHGAGVAKARELGHEEGAIAGLVMVVAGLVNVLGATVIMAFLR
ncbi:LrgB family protein [Termitidicoccus mucosus]|uniref:Murein hydrolase effector protein LrgB n=1 Tax=Termitidicoccus mucosus TaxID=1184151 RepID=A0A178IER2_9BACT|nr:murein hydrolase effector protein LrgB [Opitutaceae bacterium TSB47]